MNDGLKYPEQALLPGLHAAPRGLAGDGPEADLPPETDAARASGPYDDQHLLPGFTLVALLDMDETDAASSPVPDEGSKAGEAGRAADGPAGTRMHVFAPERTAPDLPPITVIGLGLDGALRPAAAQALRRAEALGLPRRLLKRFQSHRARIIPLVAPLESALRALEDQRRQGRRCVVLADGDPLLYGIGATLARRFQEAGEAPDKALRILSGLSALQTACARLALPRHDVEAVSLHGRTDWTPLAHAALSGRPVGIYTDADNTPDRIARFLSERGVDWYHMAVAAHLETRRESIRRLELHEAAGLEFSGGETVLLVPHAPARGPRLGLDESALVAEAGLYTKAPVRAAALSLLGLAPDAVVWDIGAGSGSVALEAAALVPRGRVFAVEQHPDRILCIQENRRRLGVPHLDIVQAAAPLGLDELPAPDAVFVGGGLGGGPGRPEEAEPGADSRALQAVGPATGRAADPRAALLLNVLLDRLKPGGVLVASCALLSSLRTLTLYLDAHGLPYDLTQVQAAISSPLAGSLTLKAHNPIMLVRTRKPLG